MKRSALLQMGLAVGGTDVPGVSPGAARRSQGKLPSGSVISEP